MRKLVQLLLVVGAILGAPLAMASSAQAKVRIDIDLSSQRMTVESSSGESYSWAISSARQGYVTPRGVYRPTSLQAMHHSKKYHNSAMPHSIFFDGGYAIHGTYAVGQLGRPASHGCVRIAPANAAKLYSLVRAQGATISISGSPEFRSTVTAAYGQHHKTHFASAHQHRHNGASSLAYAPGRHVAPVRVWQHDPASWY